MRQSGRWPVPLPITSNLILHIDASFASSVTLNGTSVSAITDLSPSPKTVNQSTAANQPAYITDAKNGLNVMRFTGSLSHFLNVTSITIPDNHTVFHVINRRSQGFSVGLGSTSANKYPYFWFTDNNIYQDSANQTNHGGSTGAVDGWFYLTTRRNSTTSVRVRRNGTTVGTVTSGIGAVSGSWTAISRILSGYSTLTDIGEIIVYDTNLSDSDIDLVEGYLSKKWAI